MKQDQDKKELLYMFAFITFPMIFFANSSEYFSNDSGTRMLMSGALGVVGGAVGFGFYALSKNKSLAIRIIAFILLITLLVLSVKYLENKKNEQMIMEEEGMDDLALVITR